ncbi:TPA: nucleoside hydrolase [Candidatus Latescibacteria bacterium]|nr:nucleoside hydrolase [Candidatus Latescibacterota bacterium]
MDVVLDVDPGVDDAMAILMALSSPELNVVALMVVSGNVPLDTGVENARRILAFAGRSDIPVYRGADRPLVRDPVHAMEVHGPSGLGNAVLSPSDVTARSDASGYLVDLLEDAERAITILAVGPLTNLALAEWAFPGILRRADAIVVMGGAVDVPGNATPTGEFNFVADPNAASVVVGAGSDLALVPLDVTRQVGVSADEVERIRSLDSERAKFFAKATEVVIKRGTEADGYRGIFLHDPTAVAFAIEPGGFESEELWASVETDGSLTSGQLVVDRRRGVAGAEPVGSPISVTMKVDAESVLDLFRKRVLEG